MNVHKRITKVYENAPRITFSTEDKFVMMSDVHRNNGSTSDAFLPNQNIAIAALRHYLRDGFTYIELGDGDELWMNKTMDDIKTVNRPIFKILKQFYDRNRLYMIYGNHDMKKKNKSWIKRHMAGYAQDFGHLHLELFCGLEIPEGVVLQEDQTGRDILLLHGHQADFFNYDLWRLARFLVRYIWKPLALIGIKDPTSASDNSQKKDKITKTFSEWAEKEGHIVIAGHTHHPIFPEPGQPCYFNDGCCVHPYNITALEMENNMISLVKWQVKTREDDTLYVSKAIMKGPVNIASFCKV